MSLERPAYLSLRDSLVGVAAFTYALYLLHEAGVYCWETVKWSWWEVYPWSSISDVVVTVSLLGQFAGFVVVGAAFVGRLQSRAGRVHLGAYCVGAAYVLMRSARCYTPM
jgi:hypothetical protein